jgi:GNAT superfamily N-acetyltransferase
VKVSVEKVALKSILDLRGHFLKESNTLIRYNACHERGWSDSYLFSLDGEPVGYGSVKGLKKLADRDAVFEFYVIPRFRDRVGDLFRMLISESGAAHIECQSNEPVLSNLAMEFGEGLSSDIILFEAGSATNLPAPGVLFRNRSDRDKVFSHSTEPVGDYVLEIEGQVLATGGILTHYNLPFADLYAEVREDRRGQGLASYLLQELKKVCYRQGRVPAARCGLGNLASRKSLRKAGFAECGYLLTGRIRSLAAFVG